MMSARAKAGRAIAAAIARSRTLHVGTDKTDDLVRLLRRSGLKARDGRSIGQAPVAADGGPGLSGRVVNLKFVCRRHTKS